MLFVKRSNLVASVSCVEVHVDHRKRFVKLQPVFEPFASRLRGSYMCALELPHLPVVCACPLSEVLSISLIAIFDCTTLSQFVRVERRITLVIR